MNFLQAISILPVCLGVALPLNSNEQANIQSNLPIYETNIQYQYETNDVNSNDDLIIGNIYLLTFSHIESKQSFTYDIWKDVKINNILYNIIYNTRSNALNLSMDYINSFSNGKLFPFQFDYFELMLNYDSQFDKTSLELVLDSVDDNDNISLKVDNFYSYLNNISFAIVINSLDILVSQELHFERCPTEYIPYILVEPQVSDNLYVNLYNFYYDLFKNDGINSITFEIGSQNITLSSWIAHSLTIISLILFVVITILFVIWLFKFLSGFILLRQS